MFFAKKIETNGRFHHLRPANRQGVGHMPKGRDGIMKAFVKICGVAIAALSALTACSYRGEDIGDPLIRKTHWFSFVGGDDIRKTCAAGTPDRYRLVYNAVYDEQIRIYEMDSLRRQLRIRVIDQGNAGRLSSEDLLAPWRAQEEAVQLDQPTYDRVMASFAQGGMFAPPPAGLDLPSRSYYWVAAFCHQGAYGLTAWKYPSPAFDAMGFDKTLFALDPSPVPPRQAGPVPLDPQWEDKAKRLEVPVFSFKVTTNGLLR